MHERKAAMVEDREPSNTDRLERLIRESGFEVLTLGRIVDTRELAEWLNADGVKAPGGDE